jgi:hypothetical protein
MGTNLNSLAAQYLRHRNDKDEKAFTLLGKVLCLYNDDPEQAWQFTLCAIAQSKSNVDLCNIGIVLLDQFLDEHGPEFIDRIEEEAKTNPRLAWMMGCCSISNGSPIYSRLEAIIEKYGHLSGLPEKT